MNYIDELNFAKALAREAGGIAREYFLSNKLGTEHKSDDSPVTQADILINQLVIDRVKASYSDHGVAGEELSYNQQAPTYWSVDPIDGTQPFTLGIPVSTISLGLVVDGRVVAGVVYEPVTDRLFHAVVGGGAYCNGRPIRVTAADAFQQQTILLGSRLKPGQLQMTAGQLYDAVVDSGLSAYRLHSSAFALMLVADGSAIGAIVGGAKPWDVAASLVILREAGATVTSFDNVPVQFGQDSYAMVVSNGTLHDSLLELLR